MMLGGRIAESIIFNSVTTGMFIALLALQFCLAIWSLLLPFQVISLKQIYLFYF